MIIGAISIALILCNLFAKKSKILYSVTFLWMWILMAGTYGAADEPIYISRYVSPESWQYVTEYLYYVIIIVSNKIGLNFISFKVVITFIQLTLISLTVWKYSLYPNVGLVLYFIFPFPLHVVQMRSALATSIFIWSLRYILDDSDQKVSILHLETSVNDIKYIFTLLIASFIHTQSIGWLVLLIAKRLSIKGTAIIAAVFNILIMFVLNPQTILKTINLFGGNSRIAAYFSEAYQNSSARNFGPMIGVFFTAASIILLCIYILSRYQSFINTDQVELLLKINISVLFIISIMLKYTSEIYRIQEGIAVLNIMLLTNSINGKSFKIKRISLKNLAVYSALCAYSIGIFAIRILRYLIPSVLMPILNNNIFLP